jgi:hypothetical protein
LGALDNQRVFELGQRGEDAEHETAIGGGGIKLRALAGQAGRLAGADLGLFTAASEPG